MFTRVDSASLSIILAHSRLLIVTKVLQMGSPFCQKCCLPLVAQQLSSFFNTLVYLEPRKFLFQWVAEPVVFLADSSTVWYVHTTTPVLVVMVSTSRRAANAPPSAKRRRPDPRISGWRPPGKCICRSPVQLREQSRPELMPFLYKTTPYQ
jgi:hypothetical protein